MTLNDWLMRLDRIDPNRVRLGLDRVRAVWAQLQARGHLAAHVITIAGTNGKGSSAAMIESALTAQGYAVGLYTSPHLVRFTERVRLRGQEIAPADLASALDEVALCSGVEALTYFEWATLAAWVAFSRARLDVWVLEVGLGGRLDAVNVLDADLALITNIGLDHQHALGQDRSAIALEKAGILRQGQPAVYADSDPVEELVRFAADTGASLLVAGRDYRIEAREARSFVTRMGKREGRWPNPGLAGRYQIDNAAGVVALMQHPLNPLVVPDQAIADGLRRARIAGRFERLSIAGREVILDVAHNREGVRALVDTLREMPPARHLAVFSALDDKPIEALVGLTGDLFARWYIAPAASERAATAARMEAALKSVGRMDMHDETTVTDAYTLAFAKSEPGDRIVVFGSFLTVGAVRAAINEAGGKIG